MEQPLLDVRNLKTHFRTSDGLARAVDGISFSVYPNQTVALVGESGCGKSVTSLSIMRLVPVPPAILTGEILLEQENLLTLSERAMCKVRGGKIAMIFQEPMTSLNPVFTIGEQVLEAILLHQKVTDEQAQQIAIQALRDVGIADPARRLNEYPHQMSGGMKQRVMIAMALACRPALVIADEPTTALDVTIQAQILELLNRLQQQTGMSVLFITHDLGIVAENADVVAVMYAGRIVEMANVFALFKNPLHPYTQGLLACVPRLGQESQRLFSISGTVPSPIRYPDTCRFAARCTACSAAQKELCNTSYPELREVAPQHWVACHYAPGYESAPATPPGINFKRPAPTVPAGEP
jgi:peptide/nickel transport system ATP-binding protein